VAELKGRYKYPHELYITSVQKKSTMMRIMMLIIIIIIIIIIGHLGGPGVDGRIILSWIFKKWDVGVWTGSCWLRTGTGGGHL